MNQYDAEMEIIVSIRVTADSEKEACEMATEIISQDGVEPEAIASIRELETVAYLV